MSTIPQRLSPPAPPPVLAGFETVHRYWDPGRKRWVAKIQPGEYYVTTGNELVATVLGSCVSACIRDPFFGIGGMNHFMLPSGDGDWEASARYGIHAMELLINAILGHGGRREHLEVKLFGGGRVMGQTTDVGQRNIRFARHFLATENLPLVASDLGGVWARKVIYDPLSGKVLVKRLRNLRNDTLQRREDRYRVRLCQQAQDGEVELFD